MKKQTMKLRGFRDEEVKVSTDPDVLGQHDHLCISIGEIGAYLHIYIDPKTGAIALDIFKATGQSPGKVLVHDFTWPGKE